MVTEIDGLPVSLTTTLKPAGEELPRSSVAVHDTGVVPIENELPEAGVQATTTGSLTLLTSLGVEMLKFTLVDDVAVEPGTSGRGPNAGGVVSATMTLKESTTVESLLSVQVTGVVAIGKREFGAGSQVESAGGMKFTLAPPELVASAVMSLLKDQCIADADGINTSARTTMRRSRRKAKP